MKKLLAILLTATLLLGLPSISMAAKGKKGGLSVHGKVTAVTDATDKAPGSITVSAGKKKAPTVETITVPAGTPVKGEDGNAVALNSLVGKSVTVKESAAGTASEIVVGAAKGKGKKKKK